MLGGRIRGRRLSDPASEALDNLVTDFRGSGGRQSENGGVTQRLNHAAEFKVVGPEVVAPLADAMRLVDDEEGGFCFPQLVQGCFFSKLFGREKQELEVSFGNLRERCSAPEQRAARSSLSRLRLYGAACDGIRLIFLKGDQRRHDNGCAIDQQSGGLVDGGFSGSGRLDDEGIVAGENRANGLFLAFAQRLEAEFFTSDSFYFRNLVLRGMQL